MTHYGTTPETTGPHHDGSRSLARESRYGQTVTAVLSILALAAAGYLGDLNLSTLPGWASAAAAVAVSTAIGTLTAYATRNRSQALRITRKR